MRIGIDISQIVYTNSGVGTYVRRMVESIISLDTTNEYILFGSSLRKREEFAFFYQALHCDSSRVMLRTWPIPPSVLDILWNRLHVLPIEWFIGKIDVFWSSDWTQPPLSHACGITTIHDVSIFHYPKSFHRKILAVQKRRLAYAKKVCLAFLCDSEATRKDVIELMHIDEKKIHVVYPGYTAL